MRESLHWPGVLLTPDGGPPYNFATEYIDPFGAEPIEILVQGVPEPVRRNDPAQ